MKSEELKQKIEIIMDEIDNFALEHEEAEKRASTLDIREHQLRAFENKLDEDKKELEEEKLRIKGEREAVVKQAVANAKVKDEIEKGKQTLMTLATRVEEAELQEKKAKIESDALEDKKKELGDLQTLKDDLERREAILAKEKAIIRESNRILDIRREKIKARETQLQMESEIE